MSKNARLDEIEARLHKMIATLQNCDWCCGGGDEEREALRQEVEDLGGFVRMPADWSRDDQRSWCGHHMYDYRIAK